MPVRSRLVSVKSRLLWATPLAKRRVEQLGAAREQQVLWVARRASRARKPKGRRGAAPSVPPVKTIIRW